MKPLSIGDYLDRLGRAAGESAAPPRQNSPFRPRSLPSPQKGGLIPKPAFDRMADAGADTQGQEAPRRTPWTPKPVLLEFPLRRSLPAGEPFKPEDISVNLAEEYARGREEGRAEGRVEASNRHAGELAAALEQAESQRQEFRVNQYAEIEGAIRSGLREIEDDVGAAVTRILAPFLSQQVVKTAVDELRKGIARLCAGGSPGLIENSRTRAHASAHA